MSEKLHNTLDFKSMYELHSPLALCYVHWVTIMYHFDQIKDQWSCVSVRDELSPTIAITDQKQTGTIATRNRIFDYLNLKKYYIHIHNTNFHSAMLIFKYPNNFSRILGNPSICRRSGHWFFACKLQTQTTLPKDAQVYPWKNE